MALVERKIISRTAQNAPMAFSITAQYCPIVTEIIRVANQPSFAITTVLGLDPFLKAFKDKVLILQVFTQRAYEGGLVVNGNPI